MQQQHPCGCVDRTFSPGHTYLFMCPQHIAIANNPEYTQRWRTMLPPCQISSTTGGIPSPFGHPFQMGGGFRPGQMPPQGVHIRMPTQGTGR